MFWGQFERPAIPMAAVRIRSASAFGSTSQGFGREMACCREGTLSGWPPHFGESPKMTQTNRA